MKKKRDKKFNKFKSLRQTSSYLLKDVFVVAFGTGENMKSVLMDQKLNIIRGNISILRAMKECKHHWSIVCAALGRVGIDRYMKDVCISAPYECFHKDLNEFQRNHLDKMIEDIPVNHLVGCATISSVRGIDLDDRTCMRMLEKAGAFND